MSPSARPPSARPGSLWSGQLTAALFSILATLAMWKLNPRKWLTWYFEHCAAAGGRVPADIQPFLPWNLSAEKKKSLGKSGLPEGDDTSQLNSTLHPDARISATTKVKIQSHPGER